MKKLLFLLLITTSANAQYCTSDEMRAEYFLKNPLLKNAVEAREAQLEKETQDFIPRRGGVYIIPVVFHVIHNYGNENISDAQIYDAIRIVNLNFRKLNPDTTDIIPAFKSIAADCQIELRIAQLDPNGNCTKGINRIASQTTYSGGHEVKDLIQWDPQKYLNVYIVSNAAGLAGHAVWPSDADTIPSWDGIVIKHDYVGSIGTSTPLRSVVLSHELGHYLNLHHIWGGNNVPGFYYLPVSDPGNCSYDDLVSDTPNTIGWNVCNLNASSCGNSVDNVQNFMDYAYCARMFTEGQKTRMQACLNSTIAGRNNLWQSSNLIATGTDGIDYLCAADFTSDKKRICAGENILLTDISYHGVNSRQWNFAGGSPASSVDSVVTVSYPSPGEWSVDLTAGNGTSTVFHSENNYITVHPSTGAALPYFEDFENITSLNYSSGFYVINPQNDAEFTHFNSAGNSGTNSIVFDLLTAGANNTDEILLGPFDASSMTSLQLSFYYAYAMRDTIAGDELFKVSVSGDCGQSWSVRKTLNASSLETALPQSTAFIPDSSEWVRTTVTNINSGFLTNSFMLKFSITSGYGNRLYLDDINLDANVGIKESSLTSSVQLFPNPAAHFLNIRFDSPEYSETDLLITDMTGKIIYSGRMEVSTGENNGSIDVSDFPRGIYILQLKNENEIITSKFVR